MIVIQKVENYIELNKKLLKLIDKIPNNPLIETGPISHTDWNLPRTFKREYLDCFIPAIQPQLNNLKNQFRSKEYKIANIWFQQYTHNNYHDWHCHGEANFANVYFVELPSNSIGTEILGMENLNLKEGDLLTFPAFLYHRSPKNITNDRKTVIAFNTNLSDFNDKSN